MIDGTSGGARDGGPSARPHPATVIQRRAPHPATVVQRRAPHPATVVQRRTPHPASVAQPRAPHPASGAPRPVAQRAIVTYDVTNWKFAKFKTHLSNHPKDDLEEWDAYESRIKSTFRNYDPGTQDKFFGNALNNYKLTSAPKTSTIAVNKPKLWSIAYIHNGSRWTSASHQDKIYKGRSPTNRHTEQELYATMTLPRNRVWIGFEQNEYPCINDGCCDYFRYVSTQPGIAGVIFTVRDSGGYALEHGFEIGASGHVYFHDGQMSYDAPEGANAPEPIPI